LERGENPRSSPAAETRVRDRTAAPKTNADDLLRFIDELADMLPAPERE
jgi:hypothetical protein